MESGGRSRGVASFTTTHWNVVLSAAHESSPGADGAMARLCEIYWYPLYAYVRRQGYKPEEAQDHTQEFFARLLSGNALRSINPEKGKFRTFLLASMDHFLAKQWRDANRLKRGGGLTFLSLDDSEAEERYRKEPVLETTAEHLFERRWALTLIEQALRRLRDEFARTQKTALFEALEPFLTADKSGGSSYAEIGSRLNMTEGAVKVAVHRLRARYGELVRDEIGRTVSSTDEVDAELQYLLEVLGRRH